MKTKLLFILFLLIYSTLLATVLMDGSLNNFYIQHFHPFKYIEGNNLLGRVIVQNNNANGFKVELASSNNGKLVNVNTDSVYADIDYTINFQTGSGHLGDGVIDNYSTSELMIPHTLFNAVSPSGSTDIATSVILTLTNYNESLMMAGHYKDTITVTYTNY